MEHKDLVHGRIAIPDFIAKLIETPHFQRLKKIKQLGLLANVFPIANYTRYDHSIGTFHLASKMLECLESNSIWSSELNEVELKRYQMFRQAVQIAALFHDVGHGPFSHTWEFVVPDYKHEEVASECIEDVFSALDDEFLQEFRDNNNFGIELIKALIIGRYENLDTKLFPKQYRFLFEIVHNEECGLDVDKLDYLKRDTYFAKNFFDSIHELDDQLDCIFFESRIGTLGQHIEYRFEHYSKIYMLFEIRANLHLNFYNSPKVVASEYLLKKIIESGMYKMNSIPIIELRSRPKCTFLRFVDDEICELIKDHELFEVFQNIQVEFTEAEKNTKIIRNIPGPGTVMPEDERFHFYGNPDLKENIERDRKLNIRPYRFRWSNLQ